MEQTLGKRIVTNRKRLGMTQDQLAEQLGVTAQAVSKWENDQSCPDITMIPRLADIFGISTDALLGREEASPAREAEVVEDSNTDSGVHNVEVSVGGGKKSALCFAIVVLSIGALYLLSALLHWELSFGTILWTTSLTVYGLCGLWPKFSFFRLGCVLVGGYHLISRIVPLPFDLSGQVVVACVILLFGLSLLADALKKNKKPSISVTYTDSDGHRHAGKRKSTYEAGAESFSYSGSFGSNRQRVDLETLRCGSVDTSFGDFTVDLSGVEKLAENAVLDADCSFGELTVLLPRSFRVRLDSDTSFGSVDVQGQADPDVQQELLVRGCANFGEIVIRYI